jgi:hypothetical protein
MKDERCQLYSSGDDEVARYALIMLHATRTFTL